MTERLKMEVGAMLLQRTRAEIAFHGLPYKEFRGFLSSIFVVEGERDDLAALAAACQRIARK
jgi:hypothetical protein